LARDNRALSESIRVVTHTHTHTHTTVCSLGHIYAHSGLTVSHEDAFLLSNTVLFAHSAEMPLHDVCFHLLVLLSSLISCLHALCLLCIRSIFMCALSLHVSMFSNHVCGENLAILVCTKKDGLTKSTSLQCWICWTCVLQQGLWCLSQYTSTATVAQLYCACNSTDYFHPRIAGGSNKELNGDTTHIEMVLNCNGK